MIRARGRRLHRNPALAFAVAATLASSLWAAHASAAGATIRVSPEAADPATLSVQAAAVAPPGVGAFIVDVGYDQTMVHPLSCEAAAGFFCNASFKDLKTGASSVRCGGFDAAGRAGDVDLCRVSFTSASTASSCSDLTVAVREFADANGASIATNAVDGNVCAGASTAATSTDGALRDGASAGGGAPGAVGSEGASRSTTAPGATGSVAGASQPGATDSGSSGSAPASPNAAAGGGSETGGAGDGSASATDPASTQGAQGSASQDAKPGTSGDESGSAADTKVIAPAGSPRQAAPGAVGQASSDDGLAPWMLGLMVAGVAMVGAALTWTVRMRRAARPE